MAATRRHGCARVVGVCLFHWALILHHYRSTICLPEPRGREGGSCPPELLSRTNQVCGWICSPLDSVILIVVTCICFQFSRGRIQTPPPTRLVPSAVAIMPPPPLLVAKKLATPLLTCLKENLQRPSSLTIRKS